MKSKAYSGLVVILILSLAYIANAQLDEFEVRNEFREEFKEDEFKGEFGERVEGEDFRTKSRTRVEDDRFEFEQKSRFEDDFEERYKGIRKQDIIFERVFDFLGEIDESEVIPYCNDPEKIADIIMEKVQNKIGDVSNVCEKIVDEEKNCREEIELHCSGFRQQDVENARDELEKVEILANSCPVNEEAIKSLCIFHSKENLENNLEFIGEDCEFQWEDFGQYEQRNCELMLRDNICDESKFVEECLVRWGAYKCPEVPYPKGECSGYWDQKYDDKGCITKYFCVGEIVEKIVCPDVKIPECADNEYADDFYDQNGCLYYKCIQTKVIECPDIVVPHCEGILKEQFDKNGCVMGFECVRQVVCGDNICQVDFETKESCPKDCGIKCPYTKEEAERMTNECLNNNGIPEKKVEDDCIIDIKCTIKIEDNSSLSAITGNIAGIIGYQVLETYDDYVNQCKKDWSYQKLNCEQLPKDCGKEGFIDECVERNKKNIERELSKVERRCEIDSRQQIRFRKRECERSEKEIERCVEDGKRRCEAFEGHAESCSEKLTEENFRKFIVQEAKKQCKFADQFLKEEIYSANKPRKVIEKILELKEAGVSGEFRGILDNEAEDLQGISEELEELGEEEGEKGFAYKIRLFLGFAKDIEEDEIKRLELSKERLETSITSLSRLAEQMPDEVIGDILREQVKDLERQKEEIDSLIQSKEKKAKGLLRLFGLLG